MNINEYLYSMEAMTAEFKAEYLQRIQDSSDKLKEDSRKIENSLVCYYFVIRNNFKRLMNDSEIKQFESEYRSKFNELFTQASPLSEL